MTSQKPSPTNSVHLATLLASAVIITSFLCYIDEGYYNFNWMSEPGNWIAFVFYVTIFFFSQLLVSKFLLKGQKGLGKTIWSILGGGMVMAVLIIILAMFTTW